ncbi:MYG1 family protein [Haloferula sp. A504]|uniref:MYG1 family protein n=1 Tax=Haloferula sp. A504 TaxID=3373601 RepID=UPI0031BF8E11|nr:MYG1 family protein [Verrucomicrobiaceae bacterium E54]
MAIRQILTHPGGAHKDELLACAVLAAAHGCGIVRREPSDGDLADPGVAVVDVGGEHEPERSNFDHHQFGPDHEPVCALSLVLQHLGIYDDARRFCDWLETTERLDVTGPRETSAWLGIEPDVLGRLNSPVDITLLRRFASVDRVEPGEALYEILRWVGADLLEYLKSLRERLEYVGEHAGMWEVADLNVLFMPRTDPLPPEPSAGLGRHLEAIGMEEATSGLVYPDRRGPGYGLSRFRDDPRFDFTRIEGEPDVHFAHARGFVAKTSATDPERLKELLRLARV